MKKEKRMTPTEAAAYLQVAEGTLKNLRYTGNGPVYYKLAGRIHYLKEDLDIFLSACRMGGRS
jgi:hypothetical protein